jgi:DNA-directed RNA polymerase subunit RPC12/RpoP
MDSMINTFHKAVAEGPIYVCSSCDQLFYRHSVKRTSSLYEQATERTRMTLLGTVSAHNVEWVCLTCEKYLKRNQTATHGYS